MLGQQLARYDLTISLFLLSFCGIWHNHPTVFGLVQLYRVVQSRNDKYPVGSKYLCDFGWRTHTVTNPDKLPLAIFGQPAVARAANIQGLSESLLLGSLGMPG